VWENRARSRLRKSKRIFGWARTDLCRFCRERVVLLPKKAAKIWTVQTDLKQINPKSDRLLSSTLSSTPNVTLFSRGAVLSMNEKAAQTDVEAAFHAMGKGFVQDRFQTIISHISCQFFPISRTTEGSNPQCIMHWAQRSSLPTPYFSQSVFCIISWKVG